MVVGDVVGLRTAGNLIFTPAAGVEIMVSSFSPSQAADYIMLQDSAGYSSILYANNSGAISGGSIANMKVFISNSLWIQSYAAGGNSFTGIQIK
tara:strand:+ start:308 stop:589 length:282 start_codon:yes stop_codon:yes gene_type:complete